LKTLNFNISLDIFLKKFLTAFKSQKPTSKSLILKIHSSGLAKFVLLEDNTNLILVSDPSCEYHADIITKHRDLCDDDPTCLGGGRINVDDETILVYGYSIQFGQPPEKIIQTILNKEMTNKKILIKIGMGY
jgi:hypothetical protein